MMDLLTYSPFFVVLTLVSAYMVAFAYRKNQYNLKYKQVLYIK